MFRLCGSLQSAELRIDFGVSDEVAAFREMKDGSNPTQTAYGEVKFRRSTFYEECG